VPVGILIAETPSGASADRDRTDDASRFATGQIKERLMKVSKDGIIVFIAAVLFMASAYLNHLGW